MYYYDLKKHWTKRIIPHLDDKELNAILVRDFGKYTRGWRDFTAGEYPSELESCDWASQMSIRGRPPRYWKYVKLGACHWLVNFELRLAMLTEPTHQWRIVTSQKHSTVWNGKDVLFEFIHQAVGVSPKECWEMASHHGKCLVPGKYAKVYAPASPA